MGTHRYLKTDGSLIALSSGISLGENLRRIREARGATQGALGTSVGVSTATISMWENGRRCPTYQHMAAICEFLDISMDTLQQSPGSAGYEAFMMQSRETIAKFLGTSADRVRIMIEI